MEIRLVTESVAELKTGAIIVGVFEDDEQSDSEQTVDRLLKGDVRRLRQQKEINGKPGELTIFHSPQGFQASRVAVLGLGKRRQATPALTRSAVADACRGLQRKNIIELGLLLPEQLLADIDLGLAVAEGAYLGGYEFHRHKTTRSEYGKLKSLSVVASGAMDENAFKKGVEKGTVVARAVMLARDMANEPSNHMTPAHMAEQARATADNSGLKITVMELAEMENLGMGGMVGVSRASAAVNKPKLIILEHRGRPGDGWDLALVGKGLTFDSGGVSIKPSDKMEEMKFDMSGGAATIAAIGAIGQLKLGLNVIAAVPATENMPDGGAFKPGDVLRMFTGKTVEVISTDAEGRLILADAMGFLDREKRPAAIVDTATLTGACVIALGDKASAAVTNNQSLMDKVIRAGESAGERIWQLPSWEEYREQYKSDIADIKNVGGRPAGTITAGLFLSEFISQDTPWVHLDIAGTAWGDKEKGHLTKGGSGVPVATLVNLAEMLAEKT